MISPQRNHRALALNLAAIAVGMVMLSFAAVPLYDLFCRVTGYGGTTQESAQIPTEILNRSVRITFNADMDKDLPWRFEPLEKEIVLRIGEHRLTAYESENLAEYPVTGIAVYNVTPFEAGQYFHKVQCFCFDYQTLQARERVNMPISFYIDPAFDADPALKNVREITLSYTFYNEQSAN